MSRALPIAIGAVLALTVLSLSRPLAAGAQSQPATSAGEAKPRAAGQPDMGSVLVEGLRGTKGCLGVDAGRMQSGKNVIFAWFEDKQAVLDWYLNPVHRRFMGMMADRSGDSGKPLANVPEKTPLLVVASITFTEKPEIEGVPLPISSIAIELFTAAPGGAFINERFSPKAFPVPQGMHDYTAGAENEKKP